MTHEHWNNQTWLARPAVPTTIERPQSRELRIAVSKQTRPPVVLHARVVAGNGGGPDKTILRSAKYLDRSRVTVAAAYLHPRNDPGMNVIRGQAEAFGCPLWQIEESGALDFSAVRRMLALVRSLHVTVWHAHDYKSDVLGLLLRRFWPMKLVTTVHGFTRETRRTRLYAKVDDLTLPKYDRVIAVSPQLYEHCINVGVAASRLSYIPNAIDVEEYRRTSDRDAVRAELGIAPDRLVMACVGRLSKEKGVGRAIRTLARLAKTQPNLDLHLIGDGPDRTRLQTMARQLKLGSRVRFWGWQTDPRKYYNAMDVLLLPSRTEGMPNAVLEAMAMSVPIAATDVGGVRELLLPRDGDPCGIIFNQDETTWPAPILQLLRNEKCRRSFARTGRRRVESNYTYTARFEREMAIYEELLRIPGREALRLAA